MQNFLLAGPLMIYKISYYSENHSKLLNRVVGIGLERSSNNGIAEIDSNYYFSCWLAHELSSNPLIEINGKTPPSKSIEATLADPM